MTLSINGPNCDTKHKQHYGIQYNKTQCLVPKAPNIIHKSMKKQFCFTFSFIIENAIEKVIIKDELTQ